MATKKNPTKDTKTSETAQPVNPVEAKLDRIIELLEHMAVDTSEIPFKGIDCSRLFRG